MPASMQARRAVSIGAQPLVLKPAEAQQAVCGSASRGNLFGVLVSRHVAIGPEEEGREGGEGRTEEEEEGQNIPRTDDMRCIQGRSGARLGFLTRRTLTGGRRMGLGTPDMMGDRWGGGAGWSGVVNGGEGSSTRTRLGSKSQTKVVVGGLAGFALLACC